VWALLHAGREPVRGLRRALEDADVFVLESALPSDRERAAELLRGIGAVDGVLAVTPDAQQLAALLGGLEATGAAPTLHIVAPSAQLDALLKAAQAASASTGVQGVAAQEPGSAEAAAALLQAGPPRPASAPAPLQALSPDGEVAAFLREHLARALRLSPEAIDTRAPFAQLGVDSLMAVDAVLQLEQRFALRLYPTLFFEHRCIAEASAAIEALRGAGAA
jgi:acyl carrier protein